MKTRILKTVAISAAIVVAFTSCDEKLSDDEVTLSQAEEVSFVDNVYEEVTLEVDNVVIGEGADMLKNGILGSDCPVVTVEYPDSTPFPRTITIDFGEEGCTKVRQNETITKRGKIIVEVTDFFRNEGATRSVSFEDFYINDNKIEGTRLMANNGPNADGFYEFTVQLMDGKITTDEGVEIYREYERTRTWIVGDDTPRYHWDDEFLVDGTGSGSLSDGLDYTRVITSSLYVKRNCPWITAGVVETMVSEDEIIVDFGDGTCDNVATRSINGGEPEEFIMERKYRRRVGIRGGRL